MSSEHEHGPHPETGSVMCWACWARTIREHRDLTRPQAGNLTGVSRHYLKDFENDGVIPKPELLEHFITGYHLDDAQARLTRDLCRAPIPLPSMQQLRDRIRTPARLQLLDQLDLPRIALAYLDPLWNILTANNTFFEIFPGLEASPAGNFALWTLPPAPEPSPAESLLVHPGGEARWLVSTLRAAFARYRDSPQTTSLYQQLSHNQVFNQHWHNDIHVAHGRCQNQPLRVRDPVTRQTRILNLQITELTDLNEIRGFLAWTAPDPQ